jgi:hypothetical protein
MNREEKILTDMARKSFGPSIRQLFSKLHHPAHTTHAACGSLVLVLLSIF